MTDTELAAAFDGDLNAWVEALPSYQSELIAQMLSDRDAVAVALAWLSSTGPPNTETLGALRNAPGIFYDNILSQIQLLLCNDKEYASERRELVKSARAGRAAMVTAASGFIAPHLGVSPILLAPAVALTFAVLARAGKESVCGTLSQLIEERKSPTADDASGAGKQQAGS